MAKKVVIYTTSYCPYCHAAKALLRSKKVPFEEVDVTHDDAAREKIVALSGRQTVPQIFSDGVAIGGYEDLVRFYQDGKTL
jgi:glutaredoxin 3